ncbi:MAG: hypothetical protein L0Z50_31715, partial [Verrucomicrobiales bacterium]|nr:hypothetical protein [Verrucomicrobiales bacterium]
MQRMIESIAVFVLALITIPIMVDSAVKGLAVLTVIGLAILLMRRASAASRHLAWTLGMTGLLVLPILSAVLPQWRILPAWMGVVVVEKSTAPANAVGLGALKPARRIFTGLPASPVSAGQSVNSSAGSGQPFVTTPLAELSAVHSGGMSFTNSAIVLWLCGAGFLLLRLLICQAGLIFLKFKNRPVDDNALQDALGSLSRQLQITRRVTLLLSDRRAIPMTWGILRPHILLPVEACEWPADRQKAVLLHELAHIRRKDCLTQLLVQLPCALHWFNPLVWVAAWRIEVERERACDDFVLSCGFGAPDYAEHVLSIGSTLKESFTASTASVAMARPRGLESRLRSILDATLNRALPRRSILILCLIGFAAALLPIAMMQAIQGAAADDSQSSLRPTVERVLTGAKNQWMLDLDSGRTHGPVAIGGETQFPQDMDLSMPYWKKGDDFTVASVASVNDLEVISVPNEDWNMSAEQLRARLKPATARRVIGAGSAQVSQLANPQSKLPRTFLFRTQQGKEGVLQLLAFTQNPGGVKLRYQLLAQDKPINLGGLRQDSQPPQNPFLGGPHFRDRLADEGGLDLDTGRTKTPWQDAHGKFLAPAGMDVAWDDDQGGLFHRTLEDDSVKFLALPDAKDFPDAAAKARERFSALRKSAEGASLAKQCHFFAALTDLRHLAVIEVSEFSSAAATISWSLGRVHEEDNGVRVEPFDRLAEVDAFAPGPGQTVAAVAGEESAGPDRAGLGDSRTIILEMAEADLARAAKLFESRLISQTEYNKAKRAVDLCRAELQKDEAEVGRLKLQEAEEDLARTTQLYAQKLVSEHALTEARGNVELRRAELKGDAVELARVRLQQAEGQLQRASELRKHNIISESDVDQARRIVEALRAELDEAKFFGGTASSERKPSKINATRSFVRLVVGENKLTFEGKQTIWEQLPELLEKVSNRASTVLELAIESDRLTIAQLNDAQTRAGILSRKAGFEYLSYIGVQPLGSKGSPGSPRQAGNLGSLVRDLSGAKLGAQRSADPFTQELLQKSAHENEALSQYLLAQGQKAETGIGAREVVGQWLELAKAGKTSESWQWIVPKSKSALGP